MKIEEGNGAWLLLNEEGDEIARRSSLDELQAHWDRLSAAKAIEQRDENGSLIEHRPTNTSREISQGRGHG